MHVLETIKLNIGNLELSLCPYYIYIKTYILKSLKTMMSSILAFIKHVIFMTFNIGNKISDILWTKSVYFFVIFTKALLLKQQTADILSPTDRETF